MPSAAPSRPVLPVAVSVLSAALVAGGRVGATVLAVHGPALYLDVAGRVLPVVTADAVPLPTACRLAVPARAAGQWGVVAGDIVPVGEGRVSLPSSDLVVARTWRPARVRRVPASAHRDACSGGRPGDHLSTRLAPEPVANAGGSGDEEWLADGIRAVVTRVVCPGGRPDSHLGTRLQQEGLADAVGALLGRGPGLTPSGDDALAGALLATHALGLSAPLAAAVRARLGSTTAVSAALLEAAADGFAARDVVTLVDAVLARDDRATAASLPPVLALGHSSGRDLVTGLALAVECLAVTSSRSRGPVSGKPGVAPARLTPTRRSAA